MTRPAVPALLSPHVSGHAHLSFLPVPPASPKRVLVSPQTLVPAVLRSYGPGLCLTLIR